MSADPAVVKKIKDEKPVLRGVVDYAEKDCYDGDKLDLYSLVARTNRNRGLVVTIPQSVATAENVSYLHARFMTVWVRARSTGKADLYDSVFSGAYGVVSDDSEAVYDFLESFDEKTYARMPFLVAHRGLPYTHNENSVSGVRAAIEAGATHLELDGYATKAAADGSRDIVLMHDDDLARTSTGTGNVFDYTREELNAFRLDQYSDEPIPSLSDVLQIIKGTGVVLVFEIKANGDAAIVTLLKENLDKYEMYDQVVVISFDLAKLAEMQRVLPQVPTANLNMLGGRNGTDPSKAYMLSMLRNMGEYNTHIDPPKDCTDAEFDRYWLRDRGIVGWYWTFDNELQVLDGWNAGFVGLTNNRTYEFRRDRRKVSFAPAPSAAAIEEGDPVALVSEQYNGACADVTGVVAYREAVKGGWRVAAKFVANRTMYTQTVFVRDENAAPPPDDPAPDPAPEKRGCGGDIGGTCAVAASLCALLALSLVVQRKRATHR